MRGHSLGFDLGSHAAKGALLDPSGRVVRTASRAYATAVPEPGAREQDPEDWWRAFSSIAAELTDGGVLPVSSVGVTGFVPALVLVGAPGSVPRRAIMHTDVRGTAELRLANAELAEPLHHGNLLPKLLWLRNRDGRALESARAVLMPHSYIVHRLTGELSLDLDSASIIGGLFPGGRRDPGAFQRFGLEGSLFPDPVPSVSVAGTVSAQAGTCLAAGTPVVAGTGDSFASLLGCGAVRRGDLMVYLGTSGTQILVRRDLESLLLGVHFGPEKAEFLGRIVSCGESLDHLKRLLSIASWGPADDEALMVPPGCSGLRAYPHAKQQVAADAAALDAECLGGLRAEHGRGHLVRAYMEGIAFNLAGAFFERQNDIGRVLLSGGGAASPVFREVLSGVFGRPVLHCAGGASWGAALLASCRGDPGELFRVSASWSASAPATEARPGAVEAYRGLRLDHQAKAAAALDLCIPKE